MSQIHKELLISVPLSKKGRLVGFCKDISFGYCSCHTIAFAAIQIAYSLKYARIICSGLDLTGNCSRFYDENNNPMPSELSKDLFKILPFFRFMRDNVEDINIYNLSDDTAIFYDVIPFIKFLLKISVEKNQKIRQEKKCNIELQLILMLINHPETKVIWYKKCVLGTFHKKRKKILYKQNKKLILFRATK